ncbi:MAG TPA: CRISPR-associated endonuclease Cas2 [Nitrososphaeria archaeon]|jgi:CRISPR-associated protein Cas2|nr:CRISPR-associated endonuclease Cas2 [Nitrososphaeria archaeon]
MYAIMVYDVGEERLPKVLRRARIYLTRVQNSVLEGELTEGDFVRLRTGVEGMIDEVHDSVIFYLFRTKYDAKVVLGRAKGEPSQFL